MQFHFFAAKVPGKYEDSQSVVAVTTVSSLPC